MPAPRAPRRSAALVPLMDPIFFDPPEPDFVEEDPEDVKQRVDRFMARLNRDYNLVGHHGAYMARHTKSRTFGITKRLYKGLVLEQGWSERDFVLCLRGVMKSGRALSYDRMYETATELTAYSGQLVGKPKPH